MAARVKACGGLAGAALEKEMASLKGVVDTAAGLPLFHFSAQPEPFPTLNTSPERLNTPSTPA